MSETTTRDESRTDGKRENPRRTDLDQGDPADHGKTAGP